MFRPGVRRYISEVPKEATSTASRDPRIDLLRGIAVLLVMLLHYSLTYRLPASWLGEVFTPNAVARIVMNGNYGVTIFFVISGFLITTNSLRRYGSLEHMDRRAFYTMRAARILPPLILALAAILILGLMGGASFINEQHGDVLPASYYFVAMGSVLTFWHNVLMQQVGYFNYSLNIYWSLSVEEVFYLLFPVVCTLLKRWWLIGLGVLLIVVGPFYRAMHVDDEVDYLYGYLACFDAIAIGCLTAVLVEHVTLKKTRSVALTVVGALGLPLVHWQGIGDHEVFGFTGIALFTACLLITSTTNTAPGRVSMGRSLLQMPLRALRWMGRHSYELYLFHIIVLGCMRDLVPRDALPAGYKVPWLAVFVALSALVAFTIARYFAQPLDRWIRSRFVRSAGAK